MQSSSAKTLRALVLLIATVLVGSGVLAFSQGTSGSLTGQVSDPSGAAVVGAKVTLTNLGTNFVETGISDATGVYIIRPVEPGNYSLAISAPGFDKYAQTGIAIHPDESATQNVQLRLGSTATTVSVTSDAEQINTTTAELGLTVNAQSVSEMPLLNRDPSTLVFLAPGVFNANYGNSYTQSGFSFPEETDAAASGGRQGSTYYLLDGVPNMDTYLGRSAPFPNSDATQEFAVITNNFSAVYGFAPGAVVSIQVKSGTNTIHGGMFEFLRDKDFNASDYFSKAVNPLHQNQFGAFAGGPILRNKVFVFGNYQGTRSATASATNQADTPTAAMITGDFSSLAAAGTTLCSPSAGLYSSGDCPFGTVNGKSNQLLPGYSLDSNAVAIAQKALPVGGVTSKLATITGLSQSQIDYGGIYYLSSATINNYNEFTGRLDWNATPKQTVSLTSYLNDLVQPSGDTPGDIMSMLPLSTWQYTFAEKMQYYNEVLNHTWTISPTMVNVASVFWTQMAAHNGSAALQSDNTPFCWHSYIKVTELSGTCFMEGFEVGGNGFSTGWYEPSQEERTTYGLYDNFTKSVGHHSIQLGVNLQHQYAAEITQYPTEPELGWNGEYTGNGLADFLMGYLESFTQGAGEVAPVAGWQPGYYGQDLWRVKPNLSLTLGLRWDPNLPPQISGGRAAAWVPGQQSTVYPNAPKNLVFPGDSGIGSGIMATTYGYWEPRVGVAWQPKGLPKTAIHAGFGMFTQPMIYSTYNHTVDNAPFAPTFNLYGSGSVPIPFEDPWSTFSGTNDTSPFPPFASPTYRPPSSTTFASGLSVPATFSPNFKLGMTQAWNVSVEQGFKSNIMARIAYVGTETYHQSVIIDGNPGIYANAAAREYTNFGEVLDEFSTGTASYNSLQVTGEWKQSHGLQFQSNLTYSKAIDDASSSNISFGTNQLGDPFTSGGFNRGISSQNFPWIWVSNALYTTPALKGQNQLVQQILGQWEVSGIFNDMSGYGFSVGSGFGSAGFGNNNNSGADQYEDRADRVSAQSLKVHQGSRAEWLKNYFNPAAFIENAPGTFGSSGKNIMRAPSAQWLDAGIDKNWTIAERYRLQFRWEAFNALNHPSFGTPNSTNGYSIAQPGVNQNGNEGLISGSGLEGPRLMQGALKFTF